MVEVAIRQVDAATGRQHHGAGDGDEQGFAQAYRHVQVLVLTDTGMTQWAPARFRRIGDRAAQWLQV